MPSQRNEQGRAPDGLPHTIPPWIQLKRNGWRPRGRQSSSLSIPLWMQLKRFLSHDGGTYELAFNSTMDATQTPNASTRIPSACALSIPPWIQPKPHCEHQINQGLFIIPNPKKVCEPGILQKPREVHRPRFIIQKRYPSVTALSSQAISRTPMVIAGASPCECLCHCNETSRGGLPAGSFTQFHLGIQLKRCKEKTNSKEVFPLSIPPWMQLKQKRKAHSSGNCCAFNSTMDATKTTVVQCKRFRGYVFQFHYGCNSNSGSSANNGW